MYMSCSLKTSAFGTYWRIELHPDVGMVAHATPGWATRVAESVYPGAKVTTAQKKDGTWISQSILVPSKGLTEAEARKIVVKIADKLKACEVASDV